MALVITSTGDQVFITKDAGQPEIHIGGKSAAKLISPTTARIYVSSAMGTVYYDEALTDIAINAATPSSFADLGAKLDAVFPDAGGSASTTILRFANSFAAANVVTTGATLYINPAGSYTNFAASENTREFYIPAHLTDTYYVRKLSFYTIGAQPAAQTLSITVRKNGADTTLTKTVSGGSVAGLYSDLDPEHAFTVTSGDRISIKGVQTGANSSAGVVMIYLEIGTTKGY